MWSDLAVTCLGAFRHSFPKQAQLPYPSHSLPHKQGQGFSLEQKCKQKITTESDSFTSNL